MGSANEKFIKFEELEVGKIYEVHGASIFKGQLNDSDSVQAYIKLKIDGGYVVFLRQHFPDIQSYMNRKMYMLFKSMEYLPHGIKYSLSFYVDAEADAIHKKLG